MAKIIVTEDGTTMIVSDDAPDEIVSTDTWFKPKPATPETFMPVNNPVNVLLHFDEETYPTPVQVNTFLAQDNKVKLTGVMLLSDYAWLLANIKAKLSYLEIITEEHSYEIARGPLLITRFLGKDINASTVDVNVLFKRDI